MASLRLKLEKLSFWKAILVSLFTAIGGIFAGYFAIPKDVDPVDKQGLSDLTFEGKWLYICTSFDGSYQHGGRFTVQKDKDGAFVLNGERMWKDIKDSLSGNWINIYYNESDYLLWHTNWIMVRNNSQLNFEYHIPTRKNEIVGYCSGIINSKDGEMKSVKGNFYVLNQEPILTGQIIFKKVTDDIFYSKTTLPKNH